MRILVFDDNQTNRAAAQAQLKDHDLTVVGTYDEAQKLLMPQYNYKEASKILKGQFGNFNPYGSKGSEAKKAEYFAAQKMANEQATTYPNFDVVLSDLLVPASQQAPWPDWSQVIGEGVSVRLFFPLLAP